MNNILDIVNLIKSWWRITPPNYYYK